MRRRVGRGRAYRQKPLFELERLPARKPQLALDAGEAMERQARLVRACIELALERRKTARVAAARHERSRRCRAHAQQRLLAQLERELRAAIRRANCSREIVI